MGSDDGSDTKPSPTPGKTTTSEADGSRSSGKRDRKKTNFFVTEQSATMSASKGSKGKGKRSST
eukprot:3143592-Rhodomonas_salina.1